MCQENPVQLVGFMIDTCWSSCLCLFSGGLPNPLPVYSQSISDSMSYPGTGLIEHASKAAPDQGIGLYDLECYKYDVIVTGPPPTPAPVTARPTSSPTSSPTQKPTSFPTLPPGEAISMYANVGTGVSVDSAGREYAAIGGFLGGAASNSTVDSSKCADFCNQNPISR